MSYLFDALQFRCQNPYAVHFLVAIFSASKRTEPAFYTLLSASLVSWAQALDSSFGTIGVPGPEDMPV